MEGMRVPLSGFSLPVALLILSSAVANATVSTVWQSSTRTPEIATRVVSVRSHVLDSLREDVARRPDDFVTFETQTAALRFIDEHAFEAYRETEQRIIDRGVLGYWRGKALVVLPTLSGSVRSRM
jgi:hypothetical protein